MPKKTYIATVFFCFLNTAQAAFFFGGGNFAALAKNIQKMIQSKDSPFPPRPQQQSPFGARPSTPAPATTSTASSTRHAINMDKKSLFLDKLIIEQKQGQNGKKTYVFPVEKEKAFHFYIDQFVNGLKELERHVDGGHAFNVEFKERFASHKKSIDQVVIAVGFIADRPYYIRAFFLEQFNALRSKIYHAIEKIQTLNKQLKAKAGSTSIKPEEEIRILKQRMESKPVPAFDMQPWQPKKKKSHKRGKALS